MAMERDMFDKVQQIIERYEELNRLLSSPEVASDPQKLAEYGREQSEIGDLVQAYRQYQAKTDSLEEARAMLADEGDADMQTMIHEEIATLEEATQRLEADIRSMLLPRDPRDSRNVIMEIRAGAGGDEAALFAADLFHMYTQYAANHRLHTEVLSANEIGIGGYKEIVFEVKGKNAYSQLKWESGVHRVQRVPSTESSGRIHTSTATVAVLPEVDDVEVEVNERDLRIDVYRSGGKGGQSVNTTDSAVRITHLPTGMVVQCQDERSQLQNRARAMSILRARLYDLEYQRQFSKVDDARRLQVGTGERSEKIRTYNFPQSRVTDHRIGLSIYRLEAVMSGDLDEFIEALTAHDQAERLQVLAG
jgi:peptide chain release factor 1